MPVFLIYAACAFASGFALRLVDPIVLPVAAHFAVTATTAAMLNTAYALPYALAQPFLGPPITLPISQTATPFSDRRLAGSW